MQDAVSAASKDSLWVLKVLPASTREISGKFLKIVLWPAVILRWAFARLLVWVFPRGMNLRALD